MMYNTLMNIDQIKKKAVPIFKKAGVKRSSLFGSCARGGAKKRSDIDILVDFPENKSLFDFVGLRLDLEEVLGKKVDLVEYSTIKPRLKPYILGNQIPII